MLLPFQHPSRVPVPPHQPHQPQQHPQPHWLPRHPPCPPSCSPPSTWSTATPFPWICPWTRTRTRTHSHSLPIAALRPRRSRPPTSSAPPPRPQTRSRRTPQTLSQSTTCSRQPLPTATRPLTFPLPSPYSLVPSLLMPSPPPSCSSCGLVFID
ncbi:hypothetical protein BC831DRAFT_481636 [Entophlyctis helioformis]|nr:hypothetical protein BC831DRAFT_481636 [Entophlyctis helioformis]